MPVTAQVKYIRMSPRKVRLVADIIRDLPVNEARTQLLHLRKRACRPLLKLLESAVANATHNFSLKQEDLFIKEIKVDAGSVLKRWQPRAFGRATPIRRPSCHIFISLDTKIALPPTIKAAKAKRIAKPIVVSEKPKEAVEEIEKAQKGRPEIAAPLAQQKKERLDQKITKTARGFVKKIFSRKTG